MQFQLFTIPVTDDGLALEEMNKFLRTHKILEVEQELVSAKSGSHWHFCVKYIATAKNDKGQQISKIDYKQVLDENTFAIFSMLREGRKKIAEEDGVPVYAVFTNEELAGIAGLPDINTESIKKIKGVGDKKIERFGKRLVEFYNVVNTQ